MSELPVLTRITLGEKFNYLHSPAAVMDLPSPAGVWLICEEEEEEEGRRRQRQIKSKRILNVCILERAVWVWESVRGFGGVKWSDWTKTGAEETLSLMEKLHGGQQLSDLLSIGF